MQTTDDLAVGSPVVVRVDLPGVPFSSAITSVVRWARRGEGLGLQFEHLRPIEVWAINRIVRPNAKR